MTLPLATLSSYWKLEVTLNPASSSSFCASVSLIPLTSGTCFLLFTSPELITTSIVVFFFTFSPASGVCLETSPALYFLDSVLLIGFIPRSFFFSAAFACSSVIPRISGTVTFPDVSASSSVVIPPNDLKTPAAFPTVNTRISTMIAITTTVRIFMILCICGFTSSESLPDA